MQARMGAPPSRPIDVNYARDMSTSNHQLPHGPVFVIGVGPGIGTAVGRRFAAAEMPLGLVARTQATLERARATLTEAGAPRVETATGDAGDERALKAALDVLLERLGVPRVVIYNAAVLAMDTLGELDHAERQARYAVNVLGALSAATQLAPRMAAAGGGVFIATGGMPHAVPQLVSLSVDKAALRAAIELLAREYGKDGIHVATVTVGGEVSYGGRFDPDRIAEQYWRLYRQPQDAWEREVLYEGVPVA